MEIVWHVGALNGLESARRYIAEHNPKAAARVFAAIIAAVDRLEATPHIGRAGRVIGTRELVIPRTPYLVAYTVIGSQVRILAVQHGARDWPEEF